MEFNQDRPIYRQIIDYSFGRILTGEWCPGQRVPSVRELAITVAVNSHTVLKAYEYLQAHDIIVARRGLGFFLAPDALEKVDAARREEFFNSTVPTLHDEMKLLGITIDQLIEKLESLQDRGAP
ncbi:MAG: GntR family transcriptional regulator [Muribaculaceae bacterium]|nr:GntR family transcriptional regulator [Muribaculaceae bacterium]